jgi:hypothetical protein
MGHKHTQNQIDEVINKWRGKVPVEKMIGEYDGTKWARYQRYRLEGGTIFHISTDTLKLTITPSDAKAEAKRKAKEEEKAERQPKKTQVKAKAEAAK